MIEVNYKLLLDLGDRLLGCGIKRFILNGTPFDKDIAPNMRLVCWATRPQDGQRINLFILENNGEK